MVITVPGGKIDVIAKLQPVQLPGNLVSLWQQYQNDLLALDLYDSHRSNTVIPFGDYVYDPTTGAFYNASEWNNVNLGLNPDGSNPKTTNQAYEKDGKWHIDVTDEADPSKTTSYPITYTPSKPCTPPDGFDQNGTPFWRVDVTSTSTDTREGTTPTGTGGEKKQTRIVYTPPTFGAPPDGYDANGTPFWRVDVNLGETETTTTTTTSQSRRPGGSGGYVGGGIPRTTPGGGGTGGGGGAPTAPVPQGPSIPAAPAPSSGQQRNAAAAQGGAGAGTR